jgi:pyridoxal phosphate enzyme (YggS family)
MPLSDSQIEARLRDNLAAVGDKITAAAKRAGRSYPARLVAVTKYVEPPIARLLPALGINELAESRPQELWRKAEALAGVKGPGDWLAWHLIGHLQRNKVKRTLPLVACIQSADSLRLLEEISREAVAQNLLADVLLEVNTSREPAKHGLSPDTVEPLFPRIAELPRLFVLGLMTMASLHGGPDVKRRNFAALRELSDRLKTKCPPNVQMIELSMGMSGDYEVAIEEGSTIVRVGSALFEGITA